MTWLKAKLAAGLERLRPAGAVLAAASSDLLFVAGLVLLGVGCWMERESLGLIVPGAMIVVPMTIHRMQRGAA